MSEWKVGDRVQTDKDNVIRVGVLTTVETEQVEHTRYDYNYGSRGKDIRYMETAIKSMVVKWDDGEEATVGEWDVYPEDSEAERAFRTLYNETYAKINEKLDLAHAALREAQKISEETGIPFGSGISPLSQDYIPSTMEEKFPDLDRSFINELTSTYSEYGGWQHSAVC